MKEMTKLDERGEAVRGMHVPVSVGALKKEVDRTGAPCEVVDVIVHPGVADDCERDGSGGMKHFAVDLAVGYVERKYGLSLSPQYKLPTLAGKYMGQTVTGQRVRRQAARAGIAEVGGSSAAGAGGGAAAPAAAAAAPGIGRSALSTLTEAGALGSTGAALVPSSAASAAAARKAAAAAAVAAASTAGGGAGSGSAPKAAPRGGVRSGAIRMEVLQAAEGDARAEIGRAVAKATAGGGADDTGSGADGGDERGSSGLGSLAQRLTVTDAAATSKSAAGSEPQQASSSGGGAGTDLLTARSTTSTKGQGSSSSSTAAPLTAEAALAASLARNAFNLPVAATVLAVLPKRRRFGFSANEAAGAAASAGVGSEAGADGSPALAIGPRSAADVAADVLSRRCLVQLARRDILASLPPDDRAPSGARAAHAAKSDAAGSSDTLSMNLSLATPDAAAFLRSLPPVAAVDASLSGADSGGTAAPRTFVPLSLPLPGSGPVDVDGHRVDAADSNTDTSASASAPLSLPLITSDDLLDSGEGVLVRVTFPAVTVQAASTATTASSAPASAMSPLQLRVDDISVTLAPDKRSLAIAARGYQRLAITLPWPSETTRQITETEPETEPDAAADEARGNGATDTQQGKAARSVRVRTAPVSGRWDAESRCLALYLPRDVSAKQQAALPTLPAQALASLRATAAATSASGAGAEAAAGEGEASITETTPSSLPAPVLLSILRQYVEADADNAAPEPGSRQWLLAHALADGESDATAGASAARKTGQPVQPSTSAASSASSAATAGAATAGGGEDGELPEDKFLRQDALSMHFLRQKEEDKAARAKKEEEAAAERKRKAEADALEAARKEIAEEREREKAAGAASASPSSASPSESAAAAPDAADHPASPPRPSPAAADPQADAAGAAGALLPLSPQAALPALPASPASPAPVGAAALRALRKDRLTSLL